MSYLAFVFHRRLLTVIEASHVLTWWLMIYFWVSHRKHLHTNMHRNLKRAWHKLVGYEIGMKWTFCSFPLCFINGRIASAVGNQSTHIIRLRTARAKWIFKLPRDLWQVGLIIMSLKGTTHTKEKVATKHQTPAEKCIYSYCQWGKPPLGSWGRRQEWSEWLHKHPAGVSVIQHDVQQRYVQLTGVSIRCH